jgi:hypothetical protein
MLQSIPDPFDSYGSHETEDRLFSVLQPLTLISEHSASSISLHSDHTSRLHQLTWVPSAAPEDHEDADAEEAGNTSSSTDGSAPGIWMSSPRSSSGPETLARFFAEDNISRCESPEPNEKGQLIVIYLPLRNVVDSLCGALYQEVLIPFLPVINHSPHREPFGAVPLHHVSPLNLPNPSKGNISELRVMVLCDYRSNKLCDTLYM